MLRSGGGGVPAGSARWAASARHERSPVASTAARSSALRTRGATVLQGLGQKGLALVKLPEGASVTAAAQAFEDDPTVDFAEPNNISHLTATLPNDPRFGDLWGLQDNSGGDHDIDAPEAWDLNTGSYAITSGAMTAEIVINFFCLAGGLLLILYLWWNRRLLA